MNVLDTNVVSEMMRAAPEPAVLSWLNRQNRAMVFSTSVTVAEISLGLALMPAGKRRDELGLKAQVLFAGPLAGRTLSFDDAAVAAFGTIVARRRQAGRPIGNLNAQIAAIAFVRGFRLAMRDVSDFAGCGVEIDDPWILA